MRTNIFICLLIGFFICGCKKNTSKTQIETPLTTTQSVSEEKIAPNVVDAKIGECVVDITGKKYRKITDEVTKPNGIIVADVWERIGDDKSWYTPTLSSKMDKNSTPVFNSLSRNPGEKYPTF